MADKLHISNEMANFDLKDRNFYNSLTDSERKQFSPYLMIRWGSTVDGSADLQEYYLISCNERLNKHFFVITKHPGLQWLCATAVSPGLGKFKHSWIPPKKREEKNNSKVQRFLANLYPASKMDDICVMAAMLTAADVKNIARDLGMTPEQIKKEL